MINAVTILLIIPLLNNVLYPFLRDYLPNMLKRFGAGLVCAVLSLLTMFALSAAGSNRPRDYPDTQCMFSADFSNISADNSYVYNEVSEYLIILPHTLITLSEILINVTSKFMILQHIQTMGHQSMQFQCHIIITANCYIIS